MANWTEIPDANLSPGAPARSADAIALRDNVIAVTEGAAGAPKVQTAGIQDQSIAVEKMFRYVGTPNKMIWRALNKVVSTTSGVTRAFDFYLPQGGVFKFEYFVDGNCDKRVEIYRNDSLSYIQDEQPGGVTRSHTITANQGDNIRFNLFTLPSNPGTASLADVRVYHEQVVPINGV
jgi:hypothetical protein